MDSTQRQVASLEVEPRQADPLREEQVKELDGQLETLRAKMHRMETLEKSFSDTKRQLEVRDCSVACVTSMNIHNYIAEKMCNFHR